METEQDFNTVIGIEQYLKKGLSGINDLQKKRKEFAKTQRLNEFTILNGKFILDQFGQINKSLDVIPISRIVTPGIWSKSYSIGTPIPTAQIKCSFCTEKWSLDNMGDIVFDQSELIAIENKKFIGKKLSEVWDIFSKKSDALYIPDTANFGITNKKWVDLTPDPKQKDWNKKHPKSPILINEEGKFTGTKELLSEHIICQYDKIWFFKQKASHLLCIKSAKTNTEKESFTKAFKNVGFTIKKTTEIPNEYHGCNDKNCSLCTSWFLFYTQFGPIKIGTRKRVYEINWKDTGLESEISKDDVTKGLTMIHAWSLEKVEEYLATLFKKLS